MKIGCLFLFLRTLFYFSLCVGQRLAKCGVRPTFFCVCKSLAVGAKFCTFAGRRKENLVFFEIWEI